MKTTSNMHDRPDTDRQTRRFLCYDQVHVNYQALVFSQLLSLVKRVLSWRPDTFMVFTLSAITHTHTHTQLYCM